MYIYWTAALCLCLLLLQQSRQTFFFIIYLLVNAFKLSSKSHGNPVLKYVLKSEGWKLVS